MTFPAIAGLDAATQDILSKTSHVFVHAHHGGERLTPKSVGVQMRPGTQPLAARQLPLAWKFWAWASSVCWVFFGRGLYIQAEAAAAKRRIVLLSANITFELCRRTKVAEACSVAGPLFNSVEMLAECDYRLEINTCV